MKFLFSLFFTFMISVTFSYAADGITLYKKCRGCHGVDGKHIPFERPQGILAGRDKVEIELIIRAIKEGTYQNDKLNKIMRNAVAKFSDEEISEISKYISTFKN